MITTRKLLFFTPLISIKEIQLINGCEEDNPAVSGPPENQK